MHTDNRICTRINTEISAKFSCPSEADDQDCILTNLSLGGAFLECANAQPVGSKIILRADGFHNIVGVVVRTSSGGMGIRFDRAPNSREEMAEKILRYLGGNSGGARQVWRHERIQVPQGRQFTRPSGECVDFSLEDLSMTGAFLVTKIRPPVGEVLVIGKTHGRVVRHAPQGISIEFVARAP
jgi:hypothetical protein